MNLSDMLSYADISQLSSIAQRYNCVCNGHSKNELIQSILANVQRKEVIFESINELSIVELRFLNFLLFEYYKSYSLEDLLALVQQCRFDQKEITHNKKIVNSKRNVKQKPFSPREMIVRFKSNGWLFNGYSGHDRYLYYVPADFQKRYRHVLLSKFQSEVKYGAMPLHAEDESGQLYQDLLMMIQYINTNRPQASLDGVIYKRSIMQLNELSAIVEPLPSKGAWKFGYGKGFGELPERLTMLYDFLWTKKWINLDGDAIVITDATLTNQLTPEVMKTIIEHWFKRYRTPIPNLRGLVYWLLMLSSSWCTVASIHSILEPFIKPYYFDNADDILYKRILKPLKHFGMIQTGCNDDLGDMVKISSYGQKIMSELYRIN